VHRDFSQAEEPSRRAPEVADDDHVRALRVSEPGAQERGPPGGTPDDPGPGGLERLHLERGARLQRREGSRVDVGQTAQRGDRLGCRVLFEPRDVPLRLGLGDRLRATRDETETGESAFTPDQSGFYDLNVYATTKDGLALTPYDYFFTVN